MQELFLYSASLILLLAIGIIFLRLMAQYVSCKRNNSIILERVLAFTLFFIISEVVIFPFYRLHPAILVETANVTTWILQLIVCLLIIVLLGDSFRHFPKALLTLFKNPFLGFLLLLMMLSAAWSDTPGFTFQKSAAVLIVTFLAAHIAYRSNWTQLSSYIRWSTTLVAILSILFALGAPAIGALDGRWKGVLIHPLDLGALMALSAIFWLAEVIYNRKNRQLASICTAISLLTMLGAASGGAIGTFQILLLILLAAGFIERLNNQQLLVFSIFSFIIGIPISSLIGGLVNYIIVDVLGKDLSLTGRTEFWPQLMDKIAQRPILGYGYSGFWQEWRGLENPANDVRTYNGFLPAQAHNGFIELALALGLVGLTLFLICYFRVIILSLSYLRQSRLPESVFPLILVVFVVMTNISNSFLLAPRFAWFCFILVVVRLTLDVNRRKIVSSTAQYKPIEERVF